MLLERCKISPTILIVEDLQWADGATLALLKRIVESNYGPPLLTITTARTGYATPWSGQPGTSELHLTRLSASGTDTLLQSRLEQPNPPPGLASFVAEKSDGNPLFAEEIIAYLQNSGALHGADGDLVFDVGMGGAALPVAIENLLMDRVDRLESGPRAVLETAAATGAKFTAEQLARAADQGREMAQYMETLVRQDLIRLDGATGAYGFRHALTRDAIYDSLLSARRLSLHRQIAEAMEAQDNFQPDDAAETLAYHWSRSAEPGRAVPYLALAGENGLRIYTLEEAQNQLQQALDIIEANPGCVDDTVLADILLLIARALYFQFDFGALIALVKPYLERVEALGDTRRLARFLFETGYAHVFGCQAETGRAFLDRARALADADGDELAVAYADMGIMWHRSFWGQPGDERHNAQREAGARVVEVARRHGDIWLASKAQLANGLDLVAWGHLGEGRAELTKLMAMSRETNDPRPRTMAQWALASADMLAGNYADAIEKADDALRICLSPVDRAAAGGYRGAAVALSGKGHEDGRAITGIMRELRRKSCYMVMPAINMALGVGKVIQGEMAAGVRAVEAARDEGENWDMIGMDAMSDLFLGETYMQMAFSKEKPPLSVILGNLPFLLRTLPFAKAKARRHLQSALDNYRTLDMPTSIARCQYVLALLDQAARKDDRARTRLMEAREIAVSVEASHIVRDADAVLAERVLHVPIVAQHPVQQLISF